MNRNGNNSRTAYHRFNQTQEPAPYISSQQFPNSQELANADGEINLDDPQNPDGEVIDDEDYVLPLDLWERVAKDQLISRRTFPPKFGSLINMNTSRGSMKTKDWFCWLLH
ncbi:hypothetical protein BJ508DRAFT_302272 [Ascobolus immersus RN42]|uniref:Uncharacterized protein n=1 Tax=Ascobolus immersus RN42 TaxID=1160509 RepID=A0A3N4IIC8_ASCIM|nr:hypothetical protein BJ508DRAFT_302272 [Ascobolus immersus RN42]